MIKISIIVDNNTEQGLLTEHGLALYIQVDDTEILFDTGLGTALENNLKAMNISLQNTTAIVLSHGHYDHGGGLPYAFQAAQNAVFYAHPAILQKRCSKRNGHVKDIHLPLEVGKAIEQLNPKKTIFTTKPLSITNQGDTTIALTGTIPRVTPYENEKHHYYLDTKGIISDPIIDDMALFIRRQNELIICLGCCHAGLINTIEHIKSYFADYQNLKIKTIIGGLHLNRATAERLDQTMKALWKIKPELIVPCHCTGTNAIIHLQETFGEKVCVGASGQIYSNSRTI